MFSSFKLPSFLDSLTQSNQSRSDTCKLSTNIDSLQWNHSMQKFYTEFTILGEEKKLKTIFTKKVTSTFFSNNDSQSLSQDNQQQTKAQIFYLKKKHPSSGYNQTGKQAYDYIAFKVIFFQDKQEKQFLQQLNKQIKFKLNTKKAVFYRNLQTPINFYTQEVNSICSRHKCVYVVFKRWSMGMIQRLNFLISENTKSLKKINLHPGAFEPIKLYQPHKQSTTNFSKHSSSMIQKVTSPLSSSNRPYNYEESLVNQLNFDKVKSPNISNSHLQNQGDYQAIIAKQLLLMIKCVIRSLEFLKYEKALPRDINLSCILWDNNKVSSLHPEPQFESQKQTQKKIPQLHHNKKILTTITNKSEFISESLAYESYLLANSSIPKQSIVQLLKQSQNKEIPYLKQENSSHLRDIINRFIPLLNEMLSLSYQSPQELNQQFQKSEQTLFNSLLFKLGTVVLDIWIAYENIMGQITQSNFSSKYSKTLNNKRSMRSSIKESIYTSQNGSISKINWLKIAQLINHLGKSNIQTPMKQSQYTVSNQSFVSCSEVKLLKKTLKLLISRSAIQRASVINLISSNEYISVISGKSLLNEPHRQKLFKKSSNQSYVSQQLPYEGLNLLKHQSSQYSNAGYSQNSQINRQNINRVKPISLSNNSNLSLYGFKHIAQSPQLINQIGSQIIMNQNLHNRHDYSHQQNQHSHTGFDPKKAYFKVISQDIQPSSLSLKNMSIDSSKSIPSFEFNTATPSKYQHHHSPSQATYSTFPTYKLPNSSVSGSYYSNSNNYMQTDSYLALSNRYQNSNNTQSSSQYCTPTFIEDSIQKLKISSYNDYSQESSFSKPHVKLFDQSENSVTKSEAIHQNDKKNQHEQQSPSLQQSPIHNPELKVQISVSAQQLPSHLPETSSQKIDIAEHNLPLNQLSNGINHSHSNIFIQEDSSQPSQKNISIDSQKHIQQLNHTEHQEKGQVFKKRTSSKLSHIQTQEKQLQLQSEHQIRTKSSESGSDLQQPRYVSEQYKGGGRYQGYIKNNKRHGYGRLDYHEGSRYQGEWVNDRMNGYGKLYYSNGNLAYEGYWICDQFHGTGKVYNDTPTMLDDSFDYTNFNNLEQQWVHYQGQLQHDLKQGHGTIMLQNGEWFQGQFHNDRINGQGKFVNLQGEAIYGKWKDNIMVEEYSA